MQALTEDLIATAWAAAWNEGDLNALDALVTGDYRRVSRSTGSVASLDEFKYEITEVRAAFPDLVTEIDRILIDGDQAAVFWHSTGTFSGVLGDVPPTGSRVETRGSNLLALREGRIAREQVTWDASELLADIGVPSLRSAFAMDVDEVVVDEPGRPSTFDLMKGFNRQFITGVTVVTTIDVDGTPRGLAANSYASVSLEPPLVLVCVQKTSSTYASLFGSTHLGINILSRDQVDTVKTFASKSADKFAGVDWHAGPSGSPLIEGSSAVLEAQIMERFQAKTHTVFIGRVRHAEVSDVEPMIYRGGRFFDSQDLTALSS